MPVSAVPSLTLQTPVAPGGRLPALDELKGIAILLVVLYHAGGVLTWENYLHGDLGVDIFVILSGLGLAMSPAYPGAGAFLKRRLIRILPTYWIVLTALVLLNTHFLQHHYSATNIGLHYLGIHGWFGDFLAMSINDSFWFITLILSLYLIYVLLQRLAPDPDRLLLVGAVISTCAAFAWFLTSQAGSYGHIGLRVPGFFYGLLIGRLLRSGTLTLPFSPRLMIALFVFLCIPYTRGIVFHTGVTALALMGFYVFFVRTHLQGPTGTQVRSGLTFLGDHSLEIFLLHQPLIREYNVYLHGRWLDIPVPTRPSLVIGMLIGFGTTLLLSYELRRMLQRFLPK